jgi:hypothetical protein
MIPGDCNAIPTQLQSNRRGCKAISEEIYKQLPRDNLLACAPDTHHLKPRKYTSIAGEERGGVREAAEAMAGAGLLGVPYREGVYVYVCV